MSTERQGGAAFTRRDSAAERLAADYLRLEGLNPDGLVIQAGRYNDSFVLHVRFRELWVMSGDKTSQRIFLTVEHSESDPSVFLNNAALTLWLMARCNETLALAHSEWTGRGMPWPEGYPRPEYRTVHDVEGLVEQAKLPAVGHGVHAR